MDKLFKAHTLFPLIVSDAQADTLRMAMENCVALGCGDKHRHGLTVVIDVAREQTAELQGAIEEVVTAVHDEYGESEALDGCECKTCRVIRALSRLAATRGNTDG